MFLKPLSCVIIGAPPHQHSLCYPLEIQGGNGNAVQLLPDPGLMWSGEATSGKGLPESDPGRAGSGGGQEGAVSTFVHTSPSP